jgi:hypothetical protein
MTDLQSRLLGAYQVRMLINNMLPQKHKGLYKVVEEVISKTIPLWNMALTPLKIQHVDPPNPCIIDYSRPPRIVVDRMVFDPDEDFEAIRDRIPEGG